eukprot:scaffold23434_cov135-Isochrysis_galbana.AAC.6
MTRIMRNRHEGKCEGNGLNVYSTLGGGDSNGSSHGRLMAKAWGRTYASEAMDDGWMDGHGGMADGSSPPAQYHWAGGGEEWLVT